MMMITVVVVEMMSMITIIIKEVHCFALALCLLIQNSSEENSDIIYWTSINFKRVLFLIVCWALVRKTAERWPKAAQKILCTAFVGADHQIHSLWKNRSSSQFRILEEVGICQLGNCFILCFKISHSPPGTKLEHFWSQSVTGVRI